MGRNSISLKTPTDAFLLLARRNQINLHAMSRSVRAVVDFMTDRELKSLSEADEWHSLNANLPRPQGLTKTALRQLSFFDSSDCYTEACSSARSNYMYHRNQVAVSNLVRRGLLRVSLSKDVGDWVMYLSPWGRNVANSIHPTELG